MRKTVNLFLGLQAVFGAIFFVGLLMTGNDGWGALYFFIGTYWVHAIAFFVAIWALWRHPTERRRAALMIALPIVLLFLPGMVLTVIGGPLSGAGLRNLLIALALALVLFALLSPKRASMFIPGFLYRSKGFNIFVLLSVLLGWVLPLAGVTWLALNLDTNTATSSADAPAQAVGYFILFGGLYGAITGLSSTLVALFAYVGLRTGAPNRKLHVAQLVLSIPGFLAFGWLAVTMFRLTGQY